MTLRELLLGLLIVVLVAIAYGMVTDDPDDRRVQPTRHTLGTIVVPQTVAPPVVTP